MTKFSVIGAIVLACCLAGCTAWNSPPDPMVDIQRKVMRDSLANAYMKYPCWGWDGWYHYTTQYELEKRVWGYSNLVCFPGDVTPARLKAFWERHYIHDYPKDYSDPGPRTVF